MRREPKIKRAIVFVDGQNLYHAAKREFGHAIPNYDICKLAAIACQKGGWSLRSARFYTGVPRFRGEREVARFLGCAFSRDARARNRSRVEAVALRSASARGRHRARKRDRCSHRARCDFRRLPKTKCDVAVIFSQDQDLAETAAEIRRIAVCEKRWIRIACAYPQSEKSANRRGINNTDWIALDRAIYDSCLDARDYFPRAKKAAR